MKERMVIFDRDSKYAEELGKRLNDAPGFPFAVSAVSTKEELMRLDGASILLLSGQEDDIEILHGRWGQVMLLSDVQGYHAVDTVPTVFKYQPLGKIQEDILKKQKRIETEYSIAEKTVFRCAFVGIASPVGRCGKTGLAIALGEVLSQTAHVLYVNPEPFSGFPELFEKLPDQNLSDFLYERESNELSEKEAGLKVFQFHGVDILAPVRMAEDILNVSPKQIREIAQDIGRMECYDVVILDLGPDVRYTECFLPIIQKLYVPSTAQAAESGKMKAFLQWVGRASGDRKISVEQVIMPPLRGICPEETYMEQLLWSETGELARKLAAGLFQY